MNEKADLLAFAKGIRDQLEQVDANTLDRGKNTKANRLNPHQLLGVQPTGQTQPETIVVDKIKVDPRELMIIPEDEGLRKEIESIMRSENGSVSPSPSIPKKEGNLPPSAPPPQTEEVDPNQLEFNFDIKKDIPPKTFEEHLTKITDILIRLENEQKLIKEIMKEIRVNTQKKSKRKKHERSTATTENKPSGKSCEETSHPNITQEPINQ